jgi:hypothetical protein
MSPSLQIAIQAHTVLVDQTLARNCTTISPCQQDSTIIRDSEITANIVNSCGRTEIAGNIDVGEQTEAELAANRVTQVTKGSTLAVTIHQVNADGAGPYECDLDQTSNAATNFVKLQVANNVPGTNGLSQAKEQDFVINVQMPADFNCIGASTGDICTVRCRNNAVAGPFGGCFAVQQTDGAGRTNTSAAGKLPPPPFSLFGIASARLVCTHTLILAPAVDTAQTLSGVLAQVEQNKKDLPAAIAANQAAGAAGGGEGAAAISGAFSFTARWAWGIGVLTGEQLSSLRLLRLPALRRLLAIPMLETATRATAVVETPRERVAMVVAAITITTGAPTSSPSTSARHAARSCMHVRMLRRERESSGHEHAGLLKDERKALGRNRFPL